MILYISNLEPPRPQKSKVEIPKKDKFPKKNSFKNIGRSIRPKLFTILLFISFFFVCNQFPNFCIEIFFLNGKTLSFPRISLCLKNRNASVSKSRQKKKKLFINNSI